MTISAQRYMLVLYKHQEINNNHDDFIPLGSPLLLSHNQSPLPPIIAESRGASVHRSNSQHRAVGRSMSFCYNLANLLNKLNVFADSIHLMTEGKFPTYRVFSYFHTWSWFVIQKSHTLNYCISHPACSVLMDLVSCTISLYLPLHV